MVTRTPRPNGHFISAATARPAALLVALAALLAGCGGDDEGVAPTSSAASTTTTAASTTTTTTTPPLTGYDGPLDLGVLPGTTMSAATDINDDGIVVGRGFLPADGEAIDVAVWWPTPTGGPERLAHGLDVPELHGSEALRINDRGQILVRAGSRAAVIDPVAGTTKEVTVPFAEQDLLNLYEAGLNNDGDVVGGVVVDTVYEAEGQHAVGHAFRWDYQTGDAVDLGTLPGAESSRAIAIDDTGRIVGVSDGMPFVWNPADETMRPLGTTEGQVANCNNVGQVIGSSGSHTTVWDLGTGELTTYEQVVGVPLDINDAGQIVGGDTVWDPITETTITVPPPVVDVLAINNRGQLVGISNAHAALWNPATP